MTRFKTEQDVRERLGHHLGDTPDENIWAYLVNKNFVSEVLQGMLTIPGLASEYAELLSMTKSPPKSGQTARLPDVVEPDERLLIISRLIAARATEEPDVQAFRKRHMADELLAFAEVGRWIEEQAEADGPATSYLKVPLPADHAVQSGAEGIWPDPPIELSKKHPAVGTSSILLAYGVADDRGVHRIPAAESGVLGQLYRLSVGLAQRFPWREVEATTFVLTGLPPLIPRARVEFSWKIGPIHVRRLRMDIDPRMTPRDVAAIYRRSRAKISPGRHRRMTEKHLRLAEFSLTESQQPWRERMRLWNRQFPRWPYEDVRTFSRDCRAAASRLLDDEGS